METQYLVPLAENGDGTPIFIVPSAGSAFFSFVTLAGALQSDNPIYSFSLTELEVSPSTHETLEEIADALLLELRAARPKGPYHLAGHCWGGVVALDMAAKLEARGEEVQSLSLLELIEYSGFPCGVGAENDKKLPCWHGQADISDSP